MNTQHDQHQLTNFGQQVRLLLKLQLIWSVDSEENHGKGCQQRSDFMAKMHQIRFRPGLRPRPRWGTEGEGKKNPPFKMYVYGPADKHGETPFVSS